MDNDTAAVSHTASVCVGKQFGPRWRAERPPRNSRSSNKDGWCIFILEWELVTRGQLLWTFNISNSTVIYTRSHSSYVKFLRNSRGSLLCLHTLFRFILKEKYCFLSKKRISFYLTEGRLIKQVIFTTAADWYNKKTWQIYVTWQIWVMKEKTMRLV